MISSGHSVNAAASGWLGARVGVDEVADHLRLPADELRGMM